MATAHFSVKIGKSGKAEAHAKYICRLEKYSKKNAKIEKLELVEHGNMPTWAKNDPLKFWSAADTYERKNGSTYREYEIALPRELSENQRQNLVKKFIEQELKNKVYSVAIHTPRALDGGEQPHLHLMFSERLLDGIERDPSLFFKRYNKKKPVAGGAKKDNTGKDAATRARELKELRERWEIACNAALQAAGYDERIDMRSYKERGLDNALREAKAGAKRWRDEQTQHEIKALREAKELINKSSEEYKLIEQRELRKNQELIDFFDLNNDMRAENVGHKLYQTMLSMKKNAVREINNFNEVFDNNEARRKHEIDRVMQQSRDHILATARRQSEREQQREYRNDNDFRM